MPRAALALIASFLACPAGAAEFHLMVGLRSTMAAAIREEGYNCPDVKSIVDTGPDRFGSVLKVTCGPIGRDEIWGERPLRVTAYIEGDFTTKPWRDHEPREPNGAALGRAAPTETNFWRGSDVHAVDRVP
jgi:hypothetical protein